MDHIVNFFNQGWIGAVIGIAGIVIAIIFNKKSKVDTKLVYEWSSLNIISKDNKFPDDIEIIYKGVSVPRVVKTQIALWNAGNTTISGSDIVQDDLLKMKFEEGEEIVSVTVLKESRKINKFAYRISNRVKNELYFEFEFLDPGDGVILEILHTDKNRYPLLTGTVKGMPKGMLNWSIKKKKKNSIILDFIYNSSNFLIVNKFGNILLSLIGVFLIVNGLLFNGKNTTDLILLVVLGGLYIGMASILLLKRSKVPKLLRDENKNKKNFLI